MNFTFFNLIHRVLSFFLDASARAAEEGGLLDKRRRRAPLVSFGASPLLLLVRDAFERVNGSFAELLLIRCEIQRGRWTDLARWTFAISPHQRAVGCLSDGRTHLILVRTDGYLKIEHTENRIRWMPL